MCDPVTAITAIGVGLSVKGQKDAADAAEDRYEAQAEIAGASGRENAAAARRQAVHKRIVATHNAEQLRTQALRTARKGADEENEIRRQGAELASTQRARYGAGNIQVDTGSAADVQVDTARLTEVDALRVRRTHLEGAKALNDQAYITILEGEAEADALETRANVYEKAGVNQQNALLEAAGDASSQGWLNVATTIVNAIDPKWFDSDSAAFDAGDPSLGTADYGSPDDYAGVA